MSVFEDLVTAYDCHCDWDQSFMFDDGHGGVDLSPATGVNAAPMVGFPFQPDDYPPGATYLFDPTKHHGMESYWELTGDIQDALPEATMFRRGLYY